MVAGGKPLWYLQIFTTFSTFIFTIFFASTCINWAGGLDGLSRPGKYPKDEWEMLTQNGIEPFRKKIQGTMLWTNLGMGLLLTLTGSAFAYLLYKQKIKLFYSWIWFGLVSAYTIVWTVTSILFYVETDDLARMIPEDFARSLSSTLATIHSWGKSKGAATIIGLIIFPIFLYLFLSFVAYRLYVKLEVYGNDNPEKRDRDYAPGSWVERKQAADGGTWEREEDETIPFVAPENKSLRNRKMPIVVEGAEPEGHKLEEVQNGVTGLTVRNDSLGGGWGAWLEDVFDYTF
jgi:hypothetical protein